ncbi:MAG: hypothetical protein JSS10_05525 [Verrucomicrobia bacterium]|nr:hypothetical protein [Verrucomicrobiota bacterium]
MAALTRNDLNRMVHKFDQSYFPHAVQPQQKTQAAHEEFSILTFQLCLENDSLRLPVDVINKIIQERLKQNQSVRTMLIYYKGSSSLPTQKLPKIMRFNHRLQDASTGLLTYLGTTQQELFNAFPLDTARLQKPFQQLMFLVFKNYFLDRNSDEKINMIKRMYGNPWHHPINNSEEKGKWHRRKIDFQVFSWKMQPRIGLFFKNRIVEVAILLATAIGGAYCTFKALRWHYLSLYRPVFSVLGYLMKFTKPVLGAYATDKLVFMLFKNCMAISLWWLLHKSRRHIKKEISFRNFSSLLRYGYRGLECLINPMELFLTIKRSGDKFLAKAHERLSPKAIEESKQNYIQTKIIEYIREWN